MKKKMMMYLHKTNLTQLSKVFYLLNPGFLILNLEDGKFLSFEIPVK